MLDTGYWMLDTGYWMRDLCRLLEKPVTLFTELAPTHILMPLT
jgi:hypothetical protein